MLKRDPGKCPICDTPHTTCTAPSSGNAIVGGRATPAVSITVPAPPSAAGQPPAQPPLGGERAQATPPNEFSTATYRGGLKKRLRPPNVGG
jgi:hypothetical protein